MSKIKMSNQDPAPTVLSTPNPALSTLVFTAIRYALTAGATLGFVKGTYSDSALMVVASCLVGFATVVWALVERIIVARHTHDTAVVNVDRPQGSVPVQPA
jgi:hypothetical protein